MNNKKIIMEKFLGCIGLCKGHTWLSRAIRYFMNVYRKRKGLSAMPLYNHAFILVKENNEFFAVEALATGIKKRLFSEAYPKKKWNKVIMKVPIVPFTETEKAIIQQTALDCVNTPYQYTSFLSQILWTWFGIWIGSDKNIDKSFYCTEFAAYCINQARPFFEHPERVNPLDIDLCERLKTCKLKK